MTPIFLKSVGEERFEIFCCISNWVLTSEEASKRVYVTIIWVLDIYARGDYAENSSNQVSSSLHLTPKFLAFDPLSPIEITRSFITSPSDSGICIFCHVQPPTPSTSSLVYTPVQNPL